MTWPVDDAEVYSLFAPLSLPPRDGRTMFEKCEIDVKAGTAPLYVDIDVA